MEIPNSEFRIPNFLYPRGDMTGAEESAGSGQVFKDRSVGLIIVGVIEILVGLGCALLVPLSLLVVAVSGGWGVGGTDLRSMLPLLVLYGVASVAFCWIGVGSIRARRWARDLMLSLSWIWLVTGVCNFVVTLVLLPLLLGDVTSAYPPEFVPYIKLFTVVIIGILYVLLPVAFVLFYRSPDVAATCRARDPRRQWSDDLPERLLTFSIVWALMAVSVLVMPAYGWIFPFFGIVLNNTAGAILWVGVLVACLALAWGGVQRALWAWWGSIAAILAAAVSTVITSIVVDFNQIIEAMNLPSEQAAIVAGVAPPDPGVAAVFWLIMWGTFLLYVVTVRK